MKKLLLVGHHPMGSTGNSHMMASILQQINPNLFKVAILAVGNTTPPMADLFDDPYKDIPIFVSPENSWGEKNLIQLLSRGEFQAVIFVGLDCWTYATIHQDIINLRSKFGFKWISLFPYDLSYPREDWIKWIDTFDYPLVYSVHGYNLLKPHVSHIQYFRPDLWENSLFRRYSKEERKEVRRKSLPHLPENSFLFGFVGANQIRKDPQRMIKAFYEVKKHIPNIYLYMHTQMQGIYNIDQYIFDCGGKAGDVMVKKQAFFYSTPQMVDMYNSIDCLVNTSFHEGLSWTILEAMLCGVPVVAHDSTAHMELLADYSGIPVKDGELIYCPVMTGRGQSFVETRACDFGNLVEAMKFIAKDEKQREEFALRGELKAREWLKGVNNFSEVLDKALEQNIKIKKTPYKEKAVLFAQKSSAGDVFMTTRCFKGLLERHVGLQLDYMTSPQYMDIVQGNPYIRKIIPWDDSVKSNYEFVCDPHSERILPGHWGRNSNSVLGDFYWKVLLLDEPDDFYIQRELPPKLTAKIISETDKPIMVVHTTGGDPAFRTYKYMGDVCDHYRGTFLTIQVGGKDDFPARADIDMRGVLSFRATAWVMDHAKVAVTVDSFISHLAGALGVSQVCLFGSGNYYVVRPIQMKGILKCMVPDYIKYCKGLGPCSASVRDCPTPCTGIHDPKEIIQSIEEIIQ